MTAKTYDVIVIGAGPVGENVAARAVRGGLTAALIESELLGGECSYWACMPSKALLRSGAALRAARAVPGAAEAITGKLDTDAVLKRRDAFASNWDDSGQVSWAEGAGITVIRGQGRIDGPRRVTVTHDDTTETLEATHAVAVCTGTSASMPPIEGLADANPWTNREATAAKTPPERLTIIGAGAVGCELATAWSDLGSKVTLLEVAGHVLPALEPFAGELVAESLRQAGVEVRVGVKISAVRKNDDGSTTTELTDGESIASDALLVAAGRAPRTSDIGLSNVGIDDGSWLEIDDSGRVTAVEDGWLYAAGDVTRRSLLTHMGKYQARATGDAIAARAHGDHASPTAWSPFAATATHAAVPAVVFTDPEVATVGLTEQQARDAGMPVRAVEYDVGSVAGASLRGDGYTGKAKLVVDQARRVVVGFTMVAPDAGEMLHAATVAIVGEVPIERLWHAVPSYPTVSELWLRLLETYGL